MCGMRETYIPATLGHKHQYVLFPNMMHMFLFSTMQERAGIFLTPIAGARDWVPAARRGKAVCIRVRTRQSRAKNFLVLPICIWLRADKKKSTGRGTHRRTGIFATLLHRQTANSRRDTKRERERERERERDKAPESAHSAIGVI